MIYALSLFFAAIIEDKETPSSDEEQTDNTEDENDTADFVSLTAHDVFGRDLLSFLLQCVTLALVSCVCSTTHFQGLMQ